MLSQVDEELITLEAIDELEDSEENFATYDKTVILPSRILVKRNILVELFAGNYNIEDGLVNGVDGAFMCYSKRNKQCDVVWIDFGDENVGKFQRKKIHELYMMKIFQLVGHQFSVLQNHFHTLEGRTELQYENNSQYN